MKQLIDVEENIILQDYEDDIVPYKDFWITRGYGVKGFKLINVGDNDG